MSPGDWFVGHSKVGTFAIPKNYRDSIGPSGYYIEKRYGSLHLVEKGVLSTSCKLMPLSEESNRIVESFSDKESGSIETIYEIKRDDDVLLVILHKCDFVEYNKGTDNRITIYLEPVEENNMVGKGVTKRIRVPSKNDIVKKLTDLFIKNDSIFVQDVTDRGYLMIYGDRCAAELREMDPGLYLMKNIRDRNNDNPVYSMIQVYGNVKFILHENIWSEPKSSTEISVSTNKMYKTWEKYMECEMDIYMDKLKKYRLPYDDVYADGDELVFTFSQRPSFNMDDIDFKFISRSFIPSNEQMPETAEEIIYCLESVNRGIHLGKRIGGGGNRIRFAIPERMPEYGNYQNKDGILIISDLSLRVEHKRRNEVLLQLKNGHVPELNRVMAMCEPGYTDDRGRYEDKKSGKPTEKEIKEFLKINDENYRLNKQYEKAIDIALYTPDIALIQGPPGTGKTTLISYIVNKLRGGGKRVLVSSEQHTALNNMTDKIANSTNLPPFIVSRSRDGGEENSDDSIEKFQKKCIDFCKTKVNEVVDKGEDKNKEYESIVFISNCIHNIKKDDYSPESLDENLNLISEKLTEIEQYENMMVEINNLNRLKLTSSKESPEIADFKLDLELKLNLLKSYDASNFINRMGREEFDELQSFIIANNKAIKKLCGEEARTSDYLLDDAVREKLISDDPSAVESVFPIYSAYIEDVEKLLEAKSTDSKQYKKDIQFELTSIANKINTAMNEKRKTLNDIIETFSFLIRDEQNVKATVMKYTDVIGSTCAQANKAAAQTEDDHGSYHYVIIDEAARANPLDILIPLRMGSRVLMVGDHNQLPHYYEEEVIRKTEDNEEVTVDSYIKKSLFKILFENLSKSKLKFPRTVMLNEQHRMNPSICKFISDNFYQEGGGLISSKETEGYINDYGVFDRKSVVYIDIQHLIDIPPDGTAVDLRFEEKENRSYCRDCEINEIERILSEINKNTQKKPSVGIISFYKSQVKKIREMIDDSFPNMNNYSVETVDSCQGREYDISIISGVRSNSKDNLGFLQYLPGRINVSMSRAKRLLIFIGDSLTFDNNVFFRNYREYCQKNKEIGYYEKR